MPEDDIKRCYICGSDKFVDDHHYDCREGKLSSETIPLCRRCHRTYHDRGIEWFDEEYLDKIIEIENKRREIRNSTKGVVVNPFPLIKREDIKRSSYWNKIHNMPPKKGKAVKQPDIQLKMELEECQETK